jgi:hypothetical protein
MATAKGSAVLGGGGGAAGACVGQNVESPRPAHVRRATHNRFRKLVNMVRAPRAFESFLSHCGLVSGLKRRSTDQAMGVGGKKPDMDFGRIRDISGNKPPFCGT